MDASFWDRRFGGNDFHYGTAENAFVAECAARIPPGPVLCLGEGEGRNAVYLAARGHDVTAVDQSAVGLVKAERLAAVRGTSLHTIVANLTDFAIEPGRWAGIVSVFVHLPPSLRRTVHRRAAAGLKPGGVILIEAYTPAQVRHRTGGPVTQPELLMTLADLTEDFTGLELMIAREVEREVREGAGHTGLAAVVQILACRP